MPPTERSCPSAANWQSSVSVSKDSAPPRSRVSRVQKRAYTVSQTQNNPSSLLAVAVSWRTRGLCTSRCDEKRRFIWRGEFSFFFVFPDWSATTGKCVDAFFESPGFSSLLPFPLRLDQCFQLACGRVSHPLLLFGLLRSNRAV